MRPVPRSIAIRALRPECERLCLGYWFAKVKSPKKHVVWFEHSAHLLITEEPGKILISLVRYARPIAERAGDVAP
jgi:hypothetical protein